MNPPGVAPGSDPLRLLVVCTANQCRSPMGEAIAASTLAERGIDAVVVSCGVKAGGAPASRGAARAMRRRGLDLSQHVSQQMDRDTIEAADLIITMERQHLTSVAELSLTSLDRAFTLGELVELAAAVGPRNATTPIAEWVRRVSAMRHPTAVLAHSTEGDIEDPMGGAARDYRRTAEQLDSLLSAVFDALFPGSAGN